jgi:hypothetical protein
LAEVGTPEKSAVREQGRQPGVVVVKMQGFEGNEWQEKHVADIIPQLRALKTSK